MGSSLGSYEIARSGMYVNERGLFVTGHNISNATTPGYVRQQSMIADSAYVNQGRYQIGLGADIQETRQIRHTFLDNIYRQESTTLGYWETRNKTFQDVQAIMGEPMGQGLQSTFNEFWDSWQELSKEPESLTVRALVRQRGTALVDQINHLGVQLDRLQNDLNTEIRTRIDEINDITSNIAKLNTKIFENEVNGDHANDYRDQRNVMLDKLCKMVNTEVTEMHNGEVNIVIDGKYLVKGGQSFRMYAGNDATTGMFVKPKMEGTDIDVSIRSGSLKGLLEARGEVFGVTGSYENGTPFAKQDITIVIDTSDTSAAYLASIQASVAKYVDELDKAGVDYNLNLITYGNAVSSNTAFSNNGAAFKSAVAALAPTGDTGNNFGDVVTALSGMAPRPGAQHFAVVFTGESVDGNETTTLDLNSYVNSLNTAGVKTSVVTKSIYHAEGDTATENGWNKIASSTGGRLYDIGTSNFDRLMARVGLDLSNEGMSDIDTSKNILPDLRKQLNALVNVMAREVNSLHRTGKTLNGTNGGDFFTVINTGRPMEMGNIKLAFTELNEIVSSVSGQVGDNTISRNIANLRHLQVMGDAKDWLSTDDYYRSIISAIGNGGSEALTISDSQGKLVLNADSQRQAISSVSMDEEMTNMMKYQFAYGASTRAINVIDEMIETIINRMGAVGR